MNYNGLPHDRLQPRPRHDKYVACYYQSWAIYRNGDGIFNIARDLKAEHCTHLIYAFAGLNASTNEIKSLDPWADLTDTNGKRILLLFFFVFSFLLVLFVVTIFVLTRRNNSNDFVFYLMMHVGRTLTIECIPS